MKRRALLASIAVPLAGCGGFAASDPGPASEGSDDESIDATVEELLPAADDLAHDWRRIESTDENCREFRRTEEGQRLTLTACASIHETVDEAETAYEDRIEVVHKLSTGVTSGASEAGEEPDVGVEATRFDGRDNANVVFRDANAVGSIQLVGTNPNPGPVHLVVDHENAVEHAVAMHRDWRD